MTSGAASSPGEFAQREAWVRCSLLGREYLFVLALLLLKRLCNIQIYWLSRVFSILFSFFFYQGYN